MTRSFRAKWQKAAEFRSSALSYTLRTGSQCVYAGNGDVEMLLILGALTRVGL